MPVKRGGRVESLQLDRTARSPGPASQDELVDVACRLVNEFIPALSLGVVIRQVLVARDRLLSAGVRAGLPEAVEAMARARLRKKLQAASRPRPLAARALPAQLAPAAPAS